MKSHEEKAEKNKAFFDETADVAKEIVYKNLSPFDAIKMMKLNKNYKNSFENNNRFWKNTAGASSFNDFKERYQRLCTDLRMKDLNKMLMGIRKKRGKISNAENPLQYAEEIFDFLKKIDTLNPQERQDLALEMKLITSEQLQDMDLHSIDNLFYKKGGIQALREGLITPAQLKDMHPDHIANLFRNDLGIQALREELITPAQIKDMHPDHIANLFRNDLGIQALREELITPAQLKNMHPDHVANLFRNDRGIQALREGLITPAQLKDMHPDHVAKLFRNDRGIQALREKLITPEQLKNLPPDSVSDLLDTLPDNLTKIAPNNPKLR